MKSFVLFSLFVATYLLAAGLPSAEGACSSLYSPFVPLPPTSADPRDLDTCCWYADNTCCGIRDHLYDISMISDQIKDLSQRGLSDQCYLELSNLLCFWCDPNTHEFLLVNEDSFTEDGYAYLFLCPSMCDKVYYKCFDDADLISNNNNFDNSKEFCEGLDLDKFYQKDDDLFPKFRVVVTDTNIANCYRGEDDGDIEKYGGICLPDPSDKNKNFDPLFHFKGSASSVSSSWGLLLALFFSALLSWIVF